ncbi:hypothetical protein DRE_04737 [Drechslerella stenobrocha 248]|uniref:Uncharacterized protein n=1 Tax=Drechslerella stenobrocha 248 TaxID=1043628 RepID=W7HRX8_9PEZI|nr:hypothetical protein DRE_04737 [Drechslerella stenobrocha 248]
MVFRPTCKQFSIAGAATVLLLFAWLGSSLYTIDISALRASKYAGPSLDLTPNHESTRWRDRYYQQIFGETDQASEDIAPNLAELCQATQWRPDLYLNCTEIAHGLFNQVNEIKNCIRMAIDTGAGLILPSINERDSENLVSIHNHTLCFRFGHFWDEAYIINHLGRICPRMKVLPSDAPDIEGARVVTVDTQLAPGFTEYPGYFDGTRTFRDFAFKTIDDQNFTVIDFPIILGITWTFLAMNPENDPTGLDWRVWAELGLLLRPTETERRLVQKLSASPLLKKDSNGPGNGGNPPIYVACGNQTSVEEFRELAAARGYSVIDKWGILAGDTESLSQIDKLSFDAKGLLDYAVMLNGYFFLAKSAKVAVGTQQWGILASFVPSHLHHPTALEPSHSSRSHTSEAESSAAGAAAGAAAATDEVPVPTGPEPKLTVYCGGN